MGEVDPPLLEPLEGVEEGLGEGVEVGVGEGDGWTNVIIVCFTEVI